MLVSVHPGINFLGPVFLLPYASCPWSHEKNCLRSWGRQTIFGKKIYQINRQCWLLHNMREVDLLSRALVKIKGRTKRVHQRNNYITQAYKDIRVQTKVAEMLFYMYMLRTSWKDESNNDVMTEANSLRKLVTHIRSWQSLATCVTKSCRQVRTPLPYSMTVNIWC